MIKTSEAQKSCFLKRKKLGVTKGLRASNECVITLFEHLKGPLSQATRSPFVITYAQHLFLIGRVRRRNTPSSYTAWHL